MHCLPSTTQVYAGRPSVAGGLSVGPRVWAHSSSSLRCRVTLLLYAYLYGPEALSASQSTRVSHVTVTAAAVTRWPTWVVYAHQTRCCHVPTAVLFVVAWRTDRLRRRRIEWRPRRAREGRENLLMSSSTRSGEAASRNVGLSLTSSPPRLSRQRQSDVGGRGRPPVTYWVNMN